MRKVIRGYAKDQDGNPILIGTISIPHSKDKPSPRERREKRHLVRRGATVFKREVLLKRPSNDHFIMPDRAPF
jgi:hypothetical protein